MTKYEHGGNRFHNHARYDFSANINPLGLPGGVEEILTENIRYFTEYPDVDNSQLTDRIARRYHVDSECIVCGNGAVELIYKAIGTKHPERTLLAQPCFSEYEKALLENRCRVKYYHRSEEKAFQIDEDYLDAMDEVDMIILCEPNNPTGNLTKPELLGKILRKAEKRHISVILDECFLDFVSEQTYEKYETEWIECMRPEGDNCRKDLFHRSGEDREKIGRLLGVDDFFSENILVIKAFTKIYAMAGLRLGYALSRNKEWIRRLREWGPCWNVSVPAQLAGVVAIKDDRYIADTRQYIKNEREYLVRELEYAGYKVFESAANFILVYEEQQGQENMKEVLAKTGIMIRDCSNFEGLKDGYYRIAVRTHEENKRLVEALGKRD